MNPFVIVDQVSKRYGTISALNQVSFSVEQGELFGIIGPDGSGKTTLFRIIATLLLPDEGQIVIDGKDAIRYYRDIREILGYMPGKFSLYPDLSVRENLDFFASVFHTTVTKNYHLIEPIYRQLKPFEKRRAGQLSGGMKQKLALCCVLIHKPRLLILDEPTTGVDAVSRVEFWEMIRSLSTENITVIVSTPYMDEASRCNRVVLLQKGAILTSGTPAEIIGSFHSSVYSLKSNDNFELMKMLNSWEKTRFIWMFGHSVHWIPKEPGTRKDLIEKFLNDSGLADFEIHEVPPTMEDCFMELMTD